jgi:hypothetical protein
LQLFSSKGAENCYATCNIAKNKTDSQASAARKNHQGKARKAKKPQVNDLLDRLLDDDDEQ